MQSLLFCGTLTGYDFGTDLVTNACETGVVTVFSSQTTRYLRDTLRFLGTDHDFVDQISNFYLNKSTIFNVQ